MTLQSELINLFSHLPNIQDTQERNAFISYLGLGYLENKIDRKGNSLVFFTGLIKLITAEGQQPLLDFLGRFAESDWTGIEGKNEVTKLRQAIAELNPERWRQEFAGKKFTQLELEEEKNAVYQFLEEIENNFKYFQLFHTKQKIIMKEQYIPIQVTLERIYKHEVETTWAYSEADFKRVYALKGSCEEKEEVKQVVVDWQDVRKENQKIMVLADPGMGKSTLLRMEAGLTAENERQKLLKNQIQVDNIIFPLFIRLSDLDGKGEEIIDIIPTIIKRDYPRIYAKLEYLLNEKLATGKCLLLLDALDEVPKEQRHFLQEKLKRFTRNYSCPIICTSRIVGYGSAFVDGAKEVEIVPFNQKQTEAYIQTWFKNAAGYIEDDSVSPEKLIAELLDKPQILGLAQNPLLLSLICSLYQTKGLELPARRVQVYEKAVDYMLSKWRHDNSREAAEDAWVSAKKELLASLAYQFSCEGQEVFSLGEIRNKIDKYLRQAKSGDFQNTKLTDLIREISDEDGIIQKITTEGDKYLFLHRTFQEYLTAYYLNSDKENPIQGIESAKKLFWKYDFHETLILLAGLIDNPNPLLQAIIQEKDDIFKTQLLLAGRCLAECQQQGKIDKKLIEEIIEKIFKFWRRYPKASFIRSTVMVLGQGNSQICHKLQKALKESDARVRFYAAFTLGKIGTPEAVSALLAAFEDSDFYVRYNAALALGEIGKPEAVSALVDALKNSNSDLRIYAVEALGKIGKSEAVLALVDAFKDSNSDVRRKAALALVNIGTPEVVSALFDALKDSDVRIYAASVLVNIGTPEAVSALVDALENSDSDSDVRIYAAFALGSIGTPEAMSALFDALKDSDVRIYAALALVNIGKPEAVSALVDALKNSDSDARYNAASALGKIGTLETVSASANALTDSDSKVRRYSVEALGNSGTPEAVSALVDALKDSDSDVRNNAAFTLGKIGTPEAVPALFDALTDSDSSVRIYVAFALGKIGTVEILEKLIKYPAIDIYDADIFILARKLAVRFSQLQQPPFIPVYPELVKYNPIWAIARRWI